MPIYILRRNLLDNKTIESTYGIKYRRQCWLFEVNVTSGEYDQTVMGYISLTGLGGGGGNMALKEGQRDRGALPFKGQVFLFHFFTGFSLTNLVNLHISPVSNL